MTPKTEKIDLPARYSVALDEATVPHSIDAEMAVLSALLVQIPGMDESVDFAMDTLGESDFWRHGHQLVFAAMRQIHQEGKPLDLVILRAVLESRGELETVGGVAYLFVLGDHTPTPANLPYYAGIVREKALRRRLIEASATVRGMALGGDEEGSDLAADAERVMLAATSAEGFGGAKFTSISDAGSDYLDDMALRQLEGNTGVIGVPTGLTEVDKIIPGLTRSALHILAARPAMGKSAAMGKIAKHASDEGLTVAMFSLEMSKRMVTERYLSDHAKVNSRRMQQAICSHDELEKLREARTHMRNVGARFSIDDTAGLTVSAMRSRARRLKSQVGALDLIVVDYLQIMAGDSKRSEGDIRVEVTEIARGLKAMAKEFDVPVLALSQLSRRCEMREDKRPLLSDLAESGAIEAEADTVSFLYRPSYYARRKDEAESAASPYKVDEVEWIVAKQRSGPTGYVKVGFIPAYTSFVNLEENRSAF